MRDAGDAPASRRASGLEISAATALRGPFFRGERNMVECKATNNVPRHRKRRIRLITQFKRRVFTVVAEIPSSAACPIPFLLRLFARLAFPAALFAALLCLDFHPAFYLHEFKLRRAAFRSFRPDEDPIALGR